MYRSLVSCFLILLALSGCQRFQQPESGDQRAIGNRGATGDQPAGIEYLPMDGQAPYSAAVRVDDMLYVSGMLGIDLETRQLVPGGIQAETRQALENLSQVLEQAGSSIDRVVKCLVMIDDMAEFSQMNEVYTSFFTSNLPARSAFGAEQLALGGAVEIECMATVG